MLRLKLQYFGHLMWRADSLEKTLMLGGTGAGGEGDKRGWDGWMASPTLWTWVCVYSGSWWWTGRPGVLRFMGSQRVGHDWATELSECPTFVIRQLRTGGFCSCNLLCFTEPDCGPCSRRISSVLPRTAPQNHTVSTPGWGEWLSGDNPSPTSLPRQQGLWVKAGAALTGSPWGIALWSGLHHSTWREVCLPWDGSRLSQAHPSDVQAPGLHPLLLASVSLSPHQTFKPLWVCVCECVCGGQC